MRPIETWAEGKVQSKPGIAGCQRSAQCARLQQLDRRGTRPFAAVSFAASLLQFVLDRLTFMEVFIADADDGAQMKEHIRAALARDEPEPAIRHQLFDSTLRHCKKYLVPGWTEKDGTMS